MRLSKQDVAKRVANFRMVCRERGLPVTVEKLAIFETVASTTSHPTAQHIHTVMLRRFPRMSLATVYKNLGQFCRLGLVREIRMATGTSRYDADLSLHAHVFHLASGEMADVALKAPLPLPDGVGAASVDHVSLVYYLR